MTINNVFAKTVTEDKFKKHQINLTFSEDNWKKIQDQRKKYLKQGLIFSKEEEYVPATLIIDGNKKIRVKAKIKGKEMSHILSHNSFRIKVKDDNASHILGMKDFSIQRYERRSRFTPFLHHLLHKNNALSFRYVPIDFAINGKKQNHYVIEERPNKEFQENNRRKESVILSMSDDETWEQKLMDRNFMQKHVIDESQRLPVKIFGYSKIRKSPTLKTFAKEGFSLLWGYRLGLLSFEDVFDIDKYAKALIISDGICDFHSLIAHINTRYYYNPFLRKLEPVIFDFFNDNMTKDCVVEIFKGFKGKHKELYKRYVNDITQNISREEYDKIFSQFDSPKLNGIGKKFKDYKERLAYIAENLNPPQTIENASSYLGYWGMASFNDDRPYIKPINIYYVNGNNKEGKHDEVWIQNKTNRSIKIDKLYLKDNKKFNLELRMLRTLIEGLSIKPQKRVKDIIKIKIDPELRIKYKKLNKLFVDVSYAKSGKMIEEKIKYRFHSARMDDKNKEFFDGLKNDPSIQKMKDFNAKNKKIAKLILEEIYSLNENASAYQKTLYDVDMQKFDAELFPKYWEMISNPSIKKITVPVKFDIAPSFPYEESDLRYRPVSVEKILNEFKFLSFNDNQFFINSQNEIKIKKNLIIPDGYSLVIQDSSLKFHEGTRIIVRKAPIEIKNSTLTAQNKKEGWLGIIVLDAEKKSLITNSTISDIKYIDGDLYKDNWLLTGAVTFYEADVDIISSSFNDNNTEDLLNIVLSKFLIKDSTFNNTPSDAFDSDFSEGKIINSTFSNVKGDGVDISGTKLVMYGGVIENVKDKALSIGEDSDFYGEEIRVTNASIGIVSKDLSKSIIKDSGFYDIKNTVYMAFQKKGAYGPGTLDVFHCDSEQFNMLYQSDKQSIITIDKVKKNANFIDVDSLYESGSSQKIQW